MILTLYKNQGLLYLQFWEQRVDKQPIKQDCNKIEAFVKHTKQQGCQLLITENS